MRAAPSLHVTHAATQNVKPRIVSIATRETSVQHVQCVSFERCTRALSQTLNTAPALRPSVKTGDLVARTKYIPTSRPYHKATPRPRPQTVQRAAWTAAIELGASNGQAMVKKPEGEWELVRWAQGVSASSVGGAEVIPAMTAIRKRGEGTEILHGHAAVRARKRNPGDWEMFAYPKLVFMDEGTTPDVQRTLDL